MNFYAVQLPGRAKATVVNNFAVSKIHGSDCLHLLLAQREIIDIQVLSHPFFVDGLWDGRNSPLIMPAQDHQGGGFFMLFRYFHSVLY